jgi:hypothetical protein
MIKINKRDISILEFNVELEGADPSEIRECRLSILVGTTIISYLGIINNNVARFEIINFPFETGQYNIFAEFFVRDFYFRPIEEVILIKDVSVKVGAIKMEPVKPVPSSVFLDSVKETKIVKPKVTLKI